MTFEESVRSILSVCAKSEPFVTDFLSWDNNPNEWPNGKYANILKTFIAQCESNSIKYAQWKFLKDPSMEQVLLSDAPAFIAKTDFFNSLEVARAEKLGMDILKAPKNTEELIKNFKARISKNDDVVNLSEVIDKINFDRMERVASGEASKQIRHWPLLSEHIGGFNEGRIAICMAQSGFGKTNLALNLAIAAQKTMNVLYINMEMILDDIGERVLAQQSGVSFSKLRTGAEVNSQKISLSLKEGGKFLITTGRDKSLLDIEALMRTSEAKLVVVDYDQKLILDTNPMTPEWRSLQLAMGRFEELAKELKLFCIVLAQSNLGGEISSSHRMRFSASNIWSFENDEDLGACLKFPKNRFGELNKCLLLNYEGHCARISEKELISIAPKKKNKI